MSKTTETRADVYPLNTALTVSASLAQIGEFSFILVALGASLGILPPEGQSLVVAGALFSIALNPLLFALIEPTRRWVLARSAIARAFEARPDPLAVLPQTTEAKYLARHVVIVGYGIVGRSVAAALSAANVPFVVVEQSRERVETLRAESKAAVSGDASSPEVLVQAHIKDAKILVIAVSDSTLLGAMIETARTLNPAIRIIARVPNEEEASLLKERGVTVALYERAALAEAIGRATVDAART